MPLMNTLYGLDQVAYHDQPSPVEDVALQGVEGSYQEDDAPTFDLQAGHPSSNANSTELSSIENIQSGATVETLYPAPSITRVLTRDPHPLDNGTHTDTFVPPFNFAKRFAGAELLATHPYPVASDSSSNRNTQTTIYRRVASPLRYLIAVVAKTMWLFNKVTQSIIEFATRVGRDSISPAKQMRGSVVKSLSVDDAYTG